jgi:hypothetical protein
MDEVTSSLMEPLKSVEPDPDSPEGRLLNSAREAEAGSSMDLPDPQTPGEALAETQDSIQAEEGKGLPEIKVGWTCHF